MKPANGTGLAAAINEAHGLMQKMGYVLLETRNSGTKYYGKVNDAGVVLRVVRVSDHAASPRYGHKYYGKPLVNVILNRRISAKKAIERAFSELK